MRSTIQDTAGIVDVVIQYKGKPFHVTVVQSVRQVTMKQIAAQIGLKDWRYED
jgi:hypothetical protein